MTGKVGRQGQPMVSLKMGFFLAFLAFGIGAILLGLSRFRPTIHSCDAYFPDKGPTFVNTARAALHLSLFGFSSPSFYGVEQIRGKRLLMVGGGYITDFLARSRHAGVNIHLIDNPRLQNRTVSLVEHFFGVEDFGRISVQEPDRIVQLVLAAGAKYDGVFTLVEDNGPLAARIANVLGLPSSPEAAAVAARSKYRVRQIMTEKGLPTPAYALISSEDDLAAAAAQTGFPSFLKPVFGVGALFGQKVRSLDDLRAKYREAQAAIDPADRPIYYYGADMILEGMLEGSELQLEVMLQRGELVYHCFSSQYSPGREWLVFPANFTEAQKTELLSLAVATVKSVGLTDGVMHLEMFYSPSKGPQLIEINNRLSRGFLALHPIHQLAFGERLADYWASVMYLSMGLKPPTKDRATPLLSIAVFNDEPTLTGWETEGGCAVFVGTDPAEALANGLAFQKTHKQA